MTNGGGGGFSRAGLDRLTTTLGAMIDQGAAAGLVALVARGDTVHVVAAGARELAAQAPMRRDTLFRIASMTKPVVAAAARILVEAGALRLDDPVDRWLPELADRRVLRRLDGPLDDTVPAQRPITLRDLMTFRLGLGIIMAPSASYPIQRAIADAGLLPSPIPPAMTPDELVARYGALPLMHQPGECWMYNVGSEILGVLIERVAARPLADFLEARIFTPLGMAGTFYVVPPDKRDRLARVYQPGDDGRFVPWTGEPETPVHPGGSTGLVSTVDDYLAFARMLVAGGGPILTPESVALMTQDHLTPEQKAASPFVPGFWDGRGWGFGLGVTTDPKAALPRGYGWDGGLGTSWRNDPEHGLTGILFTQRPMTSPHMPELVTAFWRLAYEAIV